MNVHALVKEYSEKYFKGMLGDIPVKLYKRRSRVYGFFQHNRRTKECSININIFMRTSDNELKETILHEMTHAYLYVTNRRFTHTPMFKAMMLSIAHKEFGIVLNGNPRFSLNVDKAIAAQTAPQVKPIVEIPNAQPRFKVKSNGIVGTLKSYSQAWGKKMITLTVPGALFPFTTELTNVEAVA
jgi:hypothetical protein